MTFPEIFDRLLVPRENGSQALHEIGLWLQDTGSRLGAQVSVHDFVCQPYIDRVAGVVVLAVGIGFVLSTWRERFGVALILALLLPAYLVLTFEYGWSLLGGLLTSAETNVVLSYPAPEATRTAILAAHYDTKTDLLDGVLRAPIQFLIAPVLLIMVLTAVSGWRRSRHGMSTGAMRPMSVALGAYWLVLFLALTGGAFVPARSPGALDDGGAVAALLRLAEALGNGDVKLESTNVDIVFFAGTEVGLQGSRAYVRNRAADLDPSRTFFINAEGLGFGPDLRYYTSDRSPLRRSDASGPLVRTLSRAHHQVMRQALRYESLPVTTDALTFLAAGVPSICIGSSRGQNTVIRGLHSARDSRDRIDLQGLEGALLFYQASLREIDRLS